MKYLKLNSVLKEKLFMYRSHKFILLLAISMFFIPVSFAQQALGEWKSHLPYHQCKNVVRTDTKVYCSASGGLFYYDLEDNSLNTLSKINGLSDNTVSALNYNPERSVLILAYDNANIDLVTEDGIINIPDIKKKQIPGDKSIYDIFFYDNLVFFSCGFGIVVFNLDRLEIKDTYYIGDMGESLKVNRTITDGVYIYAATDQGIRRASLDNPFLVDYNSWEIVSDIPHSDGPFEQLASYEGVLFAGYHDPSGEQDMVYYNNSSGWHVYNDFTGSVCEEIRKTGNYMIIVEDSLTNLIGENILIIKQFKTTAPSSAEIDDDLNFWIADESEGLIREVDGNKENHTPNGPYYSNVYNMASSEGIVYAVGGGITTAWNNLYKIAQLYIYNDNLWRSSLTNDYYDLIGVLADPDEPGHVFAASYGYGLIEYRNKTIVNVYNVSNSSLQSIIPGSPYVRLGGVAYDDDGNIWMTNCSVPEPISVLKKDGTWKSFKVNNLISGFPALGDLLVTQSGDVWGIIPKGNGLFVMHCNGTIDNTDDDEYKVLDVVDENGKIITNYIFSIAEDLNGNIWLGTNQGILVYYNPGSLFSEGTIYAHEIVVPRNDGTIYGDPLLLTEKVTTIEVDGANRKWLGTESGGVFLVSDDGLNQIYNFNTSNSPLISNMITDICVNDENGEVFFGTDKGIVSFRAEATGGNQYYSDIKVFPNPVRESYTGEIAISGLVANSTVKITDISGNLVFETTSLGGQAVWDGNNFFGERVATGVYLVYLSNKDGSQAAVTKILFIH